MIILAMIILSGTAAALGVTPARTTLDFKPGMESIKVNIINNELKDMRLFIQAEGEFSDLLEIEDNIITMSSDESMRTIEANVVMTGNMKKKPGQNEIKLKILEMPKTAEGEEDAARVSATVEVVHQIRINVPYPEVYAEVSDVYINTPSEGGSARFTIPVFNRGDKNIEGISAEIMIYSPEGDLVGAISTDSISLKKWGKGKLTGEYHGDGRRGRYRAVIKVSYAGKEEVLEKEFFIGSKLVEIQGVGAENFKLGGIAKLNIFLQNMWNQRIEDVYADVEVKDSSNRQLTMFKTASTNVEADSVGVLNAYWDTEDVSPGTYTLNVILHYTRLVTEKQFIMDVGFDSISIRGVNAAGAVTGGDHGRDGRVSGSSMLIIALAVLAVSNIILFIALKRRRRRIFP